MMFKKILLWIFALAIALNPAYVCRADENQDVIDGILAQAMNGRSLQEWIDSDICDSIGSITDNYVLYMNRFGIEADFSKYVQTAAPILEDGAIPNPVTRQRSALALLSCGAIDNIPENLADETIGELGVMSYVYGLHLLNNGLTSAQWTVESLLEQLLAMQLEDGGWAVMGQYGDVDVTAMCLQVLACNRGNSPAIAVAITKGLQLISDKQLDNGGFISMGHENAESSAQVIIALTSLGIDPQSDGRFIKNGASAVDALMAYRCSDGGFAHLPEDTLSNLTATVQALQALEALEHAGEIFFDFSSVNARSYDTSSVHSWKFWALIAIAALAIIGMLFSFTRKRGRFKQLIFTLLVCSIAAGSVLCIELESASEYYSVEPPSGSEVAGHVYLSIRCDTVAGLSDDGSTPEDGTILPRIEVPIRSGDSVFDVLIYGVRQSKIQMEHDGGTERLAYVRGINYLYEYAYGDLSGWVYSVDGETPSVGCGSFAVQDGNEIIWQYTTELGEDL